MNLLIRNNAGIAFGWLLMLVTLVTGCETENSVEPPYQNFFVKYFGGDGDQVAVDFVLDRSDNSVIILGNSTSNQQSGNRLYLVKADANGNFVWQKIFGEANDVARDIEFTNDNDIIVLSNHTLDDANIDFKLLRLSSKGDPIDSVIFGTPEIENAKTVTPLIDGGFIVTGSTAFDTTGIIDPEQPDESDIFHFRCNSTLVFDNTNWSGQFGSGALDEGVKVFQYSENLFYVFGTSNQDHSGNSAANKNLLYYSLDGNGTNGSPNYLGDFDNETEAEFVMEVPDALGGGYLVAGTEYTPAGSVTMHVAKLRSPLQFNAVNDEEFDEQISIESKKLTLVSAAAAENGGRGYLLLANEARETGGNIWITKIDQAGNELWSASYGSEENDDRAAAIAELQDGKILVVGSIRLINNQYKIVLMKLNGTGQLMN